MDEPIHLARPTAWTGCGSTRSCRCSRTCSTASATWPSCTGWRACARPSPRSRPAGAVTTIDLDELGPPRRAAAHRRTRTGARRLRRRDRRTLRVTGRALADRPGREGRRGPDRLAWRSTSSRRSTSPGCCSSLGYCPARGTPGSRRPCPSLRPPTSSRPSPRHCGGRPNGRSIRACCPVTSLWRKARRCCAARLRESEQLHRPPRPAASAGDPARRVHRRYPGEPDPAHRLRADADRSPRGCRVPAHAAAPAARLRRRDVHSPRLPDPRVAADQAQRPLPRSSPARSSSCCGATSVEHESGGVAVNGFLLDMPQLFEDFVTVALREALDQSFGGRVDGQDRHYLDQAGQVALRPDIVWKVRRLARRRHRRQVQGRETRRLPERRPVPAPRLLHRPRPARRAPRLRQGQRDSPARHVVRQSGIEILCHAIDLSHPPDVLLNQIGDLSRGVASAIGSSLAAQFPTWQTGKVIPRRTPAAGSASRRTLLS